MRFVLTINGWYLGGFATFCRNLSTGLRRRGHEVVLLVLPNVELQCQIPGGAFDESVILPRGICRVGAHVQRVAESIDRLNPEILVLNDSPYAMAALPFISRSILRIPVIHSIAPDELELGLSYEQWWDGLVAVSAFVAEAAAAMRSHPRASVCPLGVPVPAFEPRVQRCNSGDPLAIISVGRVVIHQKRMDRVPAIARLLAERGIAFHWTVLGDGEYLPQLRREIGQLGLEDCFSFKGAVGQPEVAQALEASEVFVLCSDCEGMPQALLEAMAQGVVPVVSRIPGSTTCLVEEPACGYLCDPSEAGEFASAIAELALDQALCSNLGSKANARISQSFDLDAFTERFLNVVADLGAQTLKRPRPLPASQWMPTSPAFRCLGFWRSLRHQSLGQLKRWFINRWSQMPMRPPRRAKRSLSEI
jgi:glycosyltransferase involved in cell wall biosynthesis